MKDAASKSQRSRQRRGPLFVLLSVAVGLSLNACLRPPPASTIIVFVLDTVRLDALGAYGNPLDPTPHIDALAEDGVRFDQAISSSGWTLPAVGSLLTGTWPTIHGAIGQGIMLRPLRPEIKTAPEVLRANGYRTVGIANAAFVSPMVGVDRGFDVFEHRYSYNHDARDAQLVVDLAIRELHARPGEPTFLFIHLFDPHLDYAPPAGFDTRYTEGRASPPPPITMEICQEMQTGDSRQEPPVPEDIAYVRGVYQGEISFMDAEVGRFIEELKSLGLYEQSTVILTADHGEEFWDHDGFEHGHTLYDELIRVPLIVKLPSDVDVARDVVSEPVRVLDVMPTVFDVAGIEKPATFDGESMMSSIRGEPSSRRPVFAESTLYGPERVAWRTERYKYIHDATAGREGIGELYDWQEDPGEMRNLADERPELALQMRSELFDFYSQLRDRARSMAEPDFVNLSPVRIEELRSLGYVR
ncbi:MAG TPA: sulfatase [Vicinamibacteria bacterium]|nr:sulfatase [Vicinamibacteria bacterium]